MCQLHIRLLLNSTWKGGARFVEGRQQKKKKKQKKREEKTHKKKITGLHTTTKTAKKVISWENEKGACVEIP